MNNIFDFKQVFIIAELSANHNNSLEIAIDSVKAIAKSGANAVKVQTFKPESLTLDVDNEFFGPKKSGLWKGLKPYDLFSDAALPYDWHSILKKTANDLGLIFFSTPFDKESVDFLEKLDVPMYKIASLEINDLDLIKYVAKKNKPIILSGGVADLADIQLAIEAILGVNKNIDISLLKCTSEYPADFIDANLVTIKNMIDTFGVRVGVSDHTLGLTVPLISVAFGAKIIEKHFILNKSQGGADAAFSMEPNEFTDMVSRVREAELAIGQVKYSVTNDQKLKRRSLFFIENLSKDDIITHSNVKSIRPGNGIEPKHLDKIIGMKVTKNIKKGTPVSWQLIKN